jgi:glycosyltransferase involved in cell wall biosynthesis
MKKVLFIAAHRPDRSPSQRFRFEQYFSYLEKHGYQCDFSWLISEKDDQVFYNPGNISTKFYIFLKSVAIRLRDVLKASSYDIIFIQREAFMTGTTFFEKQFARSKAKVIFDFDDAIWHQDVSEANKKFAWLKKPEKTGDIIALADMIFAGNSYLAGFAARFNSNIRIVPTTIDTVEYKPLSEPRNNGKICIGWSGSLTTIKHFEFAIPFLMELKKKYGEKISIKVIGDKTYSNESLGIKGLAWNRQDEIRELCSMDIGIMPLPNDDWAKGKCGLKGLQYMALEIPAVMSPVGVNEEIIRDGINGFLAGEKEEWVAKISALIDDADLRKKTGKAARQTVIGNFSVTSQQDNYVRYFDELTQRA